MRLSPILPVSLRITDQTVSFGVSGLERQVEADELVILLDDLEGLGPRADLLGDTVQLIVEYVAEPLGEDEREDEVLELWGFLRPADAARGVPGIESALWQRLAPLPETLQIVVLENKGPPADVLPDLT